MKRVYVVFLTIALLLSFSASYALVTLPSIFCDNMVLQQNAKVKIWGWAKPYEEITVKVGWDTTTYKVMTDNTMSWSVNVKTPEASFTPYEITVEGWRKLTIKNVLIGEVWLCSGQSNMEWSPRNGILNGEQEIAAAQYPNIRFFQVVPRKSVVEQDDLYGEWKECLPETMIDFSAIGYFFARKLQQELNVPIGIIGSYVGGSPIETWAPAETIYENPKLLELSKKISEMSWSPRTPGYLYNAMIAPIVQFRVKGILWYQGEANVENADGYDELLTNLIFSWYSKIGMNVPFYVAQIAPFVYGVEGQCPTIQNKQRLVSRYGDVEMIVTNDFVDDVNNIHPKDKQTAALRFANIALYQLYQNPTKLSPNQVFSPEPVVSYHDHSKPNEVYINFSRANELHSVSKTIEGFELAGADGVFYPAKAVIYQRNAIKLISAKVKRPVQVRYAWKNTAQPTLRNEYNMPATCFLDKIVDESELWNDVE